MASVRPEEKESVKEGVLKVTRILNDMMATIF